MGQQVVQLVEEGETAPEGGKGPVDDQPRPSPLDDVEPP